MMQRELEPYGRRYEEALAMDFMEARTVTEPSAPEVETAGKGVWMRSSPARSAFVADCGLLDKPEEPFRKVLRFVPHSPGRRKDRQHGPHRAATPRMICASCSSRGTNTAAGATPARWSTARKTRSLPSASAALNVDGKPGLLPPVSGPRSSACSRRENSVR
ncbi:MAG: hypothetical protein ACLU3I_02940 [Acutalibacteraceae bacterium]